MSLEEEEARQRAAAAASGSTSQPSASTTLPAFSAQPKIPEQPKGADKMVTDEDEELAKATAISESGGDVEMKDEGEEEIDEDMEKKQIPYDDLQKINYDLCGLIKLVSSS